MLPKKWLVCWVVSLLPGCKSDGAAPAGPAASSAGAAATTAVPAAPATAAPAAAAPRSADPTTPPGTSTGNVDNAAGGATGPVIEDGCSYDARQLEGNDGARFRISCPAACDKSSSSTYGTGVYTGDSPVCKAGIHAGAIPREGGVFTIQLEAGRPAYRGGMQNGIESQDYGKYSRSYSVVSSNAASPPAGGTPQAAAAPATGTSAAVPGGEVIEAGCSYDARQLDAKDGTTFRISCPADCEKSSSTYGTGVYTGDSPVCKAGIHAGAIPLAGGVFTIQLQAGRPAYRGSTQNGIESQDYGKYSRSYSVVLPK